MFSRRSFLTATGALIFPSIGASSRATGFAVPIAPISVARNAAVAKPALSGSGLATAAIVDRLEFLPVAGVADPGDVVARIRLFGDMHFGFTSAARLAAVANDLATFPQPDAILSTGDETHFGSRNEYVAAKDWLSRWTTPLFYTVTGNHTFWNHTVRRKESCPILYERFLNAWGLPMPYAWELGGVRFVGVGPTSAGLTPAGASLLPNQIQELADLLALAPQQPTILVMHSPLYDTVLGDGGPPNSVYTSVQPGFFQVFSAQIIKALTAAPQVALVITGHTHSPLQAHGLLYSVQAGETIVPQFNAMALPFVRRDWPHGRRYAQDLVTWELAITKDHVILHGRDHIARQTVARAVVPLTRMVRPLVAVA